MRLYIVILSGIFCLFYFQVAQSAEIKVIDNNVFVETDTYQVQFTDGVITHLSNKLTTETYTLPLGGAVTGFRGRSGLLKRDGRSIWTDQATLTEARKIAPLKAEIVFRQGRNEFRLFIAVDARSGDLMIEQEGTSETAGVYGIQWGCVNLNSRNLDFILPADGGQIVNAMSPFTFRDFHYPFPSWEVQLAILQGEQGGFFVRGADETFQFKVLHYEKYIDSFAIGFETQNQAPFDALTSPKSIVWRLNTYKGGWHTPAKHYRDWMERTFRPWRLDQMSAWVGEIGLVVTYIDPRLDVGILDKLAEQVDPAKTLLYLTQWRKDPFDINFPDYTAKPEFSRFVEAAHQRGFRVMAHVNLILGSMRIIPSTLKFRNSNIEIRGLGILWAGFGIEQTFREIALPP